jgi:hypothetical protein
MFDLTMQKGRFNAQSVASLSVEGMSRLSIHLLNAEVPRLDTNSSYSSQNISEAPLRLLWTRFLSI